MDAPPSIRLTGKVLTVPHPWTSQHPPDYAAPSQPEVGDMKISATINPAARAHGGNPSSICRGSLSATVFDGICWCRFDLSTLTSYTTFEDRAGLDAALLHTRSAIQSQAGRECFTLSLESGSPPVYGLSRPVIAPKKKPRVTRGRGFETST